MRRVLTFGLVALMLVGVPAQSFAGVRGAKAQDARTGTLRGIAKNSQGQNLAGSKVRIRNAGNGAVASEVTTDATGAFVVPGLAPGSYVVEVVNAAGQVIGLSPAIEVLAGATATVSVTATAVGAISTAAAGGGLSLFGLGTAASLGVLAAAGTAAIVGVTAVRKTASPSR
jgi:hypothetical protein